MPEKESYMKKDVLEIMDFATEIRKTTMEMIAGIGKGHAGGSLSLADLMAVLYGGVMNIDPKDCRKKDRDRLVLSKGHAGPALYATLALKGYFPMDWVQTLNQPGTNLPSHCDRQKTPGIDMTTGSLGQGLSAAVGMALAARLDGLSSSIYCVIGDGESQEGQIWEAGMYAAQMKLGNLITFLDSNGLQIDGPTAQVNDLNPAEEKWSAFGWNVQTVNGHDVNEIYDAVMRAKGNKNSPNMIILKTVKGKGWFRIAGKPESHSLLVTQDDLKEIFLELDKEKEEYHAR